MSAVQPIYCPNGNCECRTPQLCLQDCHFNTAEGGRSVDTLTHEPTPVRPPRFVPDFGIEHHRALRWYERRGFLIPVAAAGAVIGFAVGIYRSF